MGELVLIRFQICGAVDNAHLINQAGQGTFATGPVITYHEKDQRVVQDLHIFEGVYDAIRVNFEMWGVASDQAHALVETWKRR